MAALLVLAFLVVPILELYVILQVADVIGGWETLALLIAESVVGTWLVRREGRRTWRAFQQALQEHRAPGREVADGALVIVGGTLLLTPGFLSDILGFFVLFPPTRPLARRLLIRLAARRMGASFAMFGPPRPGRARRDRPPGTQPGDRSGRAGAGPVIEGEVVDERSDPRSKQAPPRGPDLRKGPDRGTPPGP